MRQFDSSITLVGAAVLPAPADILRPLHHLAKGQYARILHIAEHAEFGELDARVTLRLKELGFLPGAELQVVGFGLFGRSPVAVRINGTKFGLRHSEASKIITEPLQRGRHL